MAYFLFIDESGHDRKEAPYEVLGGVCIQDRDLWNLITALHGLEEKCFGQRYSLGTRELKGRKILKKKVFRQAGLSVDVSPEEVSFLAKQALVSGGDATVEQIKALALAKLNYTQELFNICSRFGCRAFASIVETDAERTASDGLRKDYGFLLERFYYFLDEQRPREQGIVVFDELEKSQSHILIGQMDEYFKETATGRLRSNLIVPEPFFVHSDLTTGIQVADLISYIVSWGFRTRYMAKPAREELNDFVSQVSSLRYRTIREGHEIWSFKHITDLRTRSERDLE
ncbi:MAG: DUF3800 domain-containing protein [Rhodospirillales bacterium]|nr:DUF3800 domain-containing protein [Rhodospirillales bacterium]